MNKLIKPSDLKPITVPLEDLLTNQYNNPYTGKTKEQLEIYQNEVKHFGYFETPIVYKQEPVWTDTPMQFLVLTNVQEVETARALGLTEMKVFELDDTKYSQTEAFRFAMHRRTFQSLSHESRYIGFRQAFHDIDKDKEWAATINTRTGKTIEKVAAVCGMAVGTIHNYMTVGNQNIQLLKDADNGHTSVAREYNKIMDKKPDSEKSKAKRQNRRSKADSIAAWYQSKMSLPLPIAEFELHISVKEVEYQGRNVIKIEINGQELEGFTTHTSDAGEGRTQIKFISEKEPIEFTVTAPDIVNYFKQKGFSTESRLPKFDVKGHFDKVLSNLKGIGHLSRGRNNDKPKPQIDRMAIINDAIKAVVKMGIAKTKAETAVNKVAVENPSIIDIGQLTTQALRFAGTL
ncbi:MAG: hypothetical protein H7329_19590 [Opitutaceae bacterium]|nr:hypothetical protein [Cytophagales bacterium]